MSREREWWLRALSVLVRPQAVFAALRDDARDDLDARQEPLLAVVWLAGIAAVLTTGAAQRVADESDGLTLAVWALLAGGIYAAAAYFLGGGLVYVGARSAGSLGTYRRARHVLGFACAPLALSLAVWPLKLALYGKDAVGGGPAGFAAVHALFAVWALGLLLVGIRAVHEWTWPRAAGAFGVVAGVLAALAALPYAL